MQKNLSEKKRFSLIARVRSANHAWRGLGIVLRTTHNMWLALVLMAAAAYLGFIYSITQGEWLAMILSFGLVLVAETINTAIEVDIDLTSPEYHPYARDTKDIAAGAVLLAAFFCALICVIILFPKFIF